MNEKQRSSKVLLIAMQFVANVLVTIGIFLVLGLLLDRWLNTDVLFTIIFIVLGVFAGVYNLIRKVNRVE